METKNKISSLTEKVGKRQKSIDDLSRKLSALKEQQDREQEKLKSEYYRELERVCGKDINVGDVISLISAIRSAELTVAEVIELIGGSSPAADETPKEETTTDTTEKELTADDQ